MASENASDTSSGPIAAPPLDGGTAWLNVSRPLVMGRPAGKVVLLDFWTYGCINCMHLLPDLRLLEQRFQHELVVIGVHSPKFPNERITENLRRILVRYQIEHPVVQRRGAAHLASVWRPFVADARDRRPGWPAGWHGVRAKAT